MVRQLVISLMHDGENKDARSLKCDLSDFRRNAGNLGTHVRIIQRLHSRSVYWQIPKRDFDGRSVLEVVAGGRMTVPG